MVQGAYIVIVYCQAHGGSHYLRSIREAISTSFSIVMCKPKNNFPTDGDVALIRDPRNRLISQYRYWTKKKAGKIAKLEQKYPDIDDRLAHIMVSSEGKGEKLNYFEATDRFTRIISAAGCDIIKFEDLIRGGTAMERFLELIGAPDDPCLAYDDAFGRGRTYTGKFSNFNDWFGPKCNDLWSKNMYLLEALGYE